MLLWIRHYIHNMVIPGYYKNLEEDDFDLIKTDTIFLLDI